MTTVTVYDPAMCCSTGVCGPQVDPALAQFAGDLDWLKGQGITVRRFNLAQEPASFAANADVKAILERSGDEALPAILAGDELVANGRYPTRQELAAWAGLKTTAAPLEVTEQVKALIALGAAIGASCEPCFKFHYDKARRLGVSEEAMRAAVQIGSGVKAASAKNMSGLADRILGAAAPAAATGASCCGGSAQDTDKAREATAGTEGCCGGSAKASEPAAATETSCCGGATKTGEAKAKSSSCC
jgi:AhpD family alkylhydroperoxidase